MQKIMTTYLKLYL